MSMVYQPRFERASRVCPECDWHGRVAPGQRLAQLLDRGSVERLDFSIELVDPLGFVDTKAYPDRVRASRRTTGHREAVVCAAGAIQGAPAVVAVMNFDFLGGSLGSAVGELICRGARTALARHIPFVVVTASGGARMQEGALSLMQMAKTSRAFAELDAAGLLTVSVITDPTYGGVAASFATLSGVIVAEPAARLGFAGRRVIEQTIGQSLPEGFQTAEFLLSRGLIDGIVRRAELRDWLGGLLAVPTRAAVVPAGGDPDPTIRDPRLLGEIDAWQSVRTARHTDRPTALDYIERMVTDFRPLRGDRVSGDCPALIGGTGFLAGIPVMLLGNQKGHHTTEMVARNFGMAGPDGYRKAARLMRLADRLGIPVVTLIDTPGAYPGAAAEEGGQAGAIAECIRTMSTLSVPTVSVVCGEGGSGGALAIGVGNEVLMFRNSVYSVISPEGCAAILWKTPAEARRAARALGVDAATLLRHGIVDGVLPEPKAGNHTDLDGAADTLRAALIAALRRLETAPTEPATHRRERFEAFGANAVADHTAEEVRSR
jgi:acetyl-CoA carboxylase carboxyl transferase subunit beta